MRFSSKLIGWGLVCLLSSCGSDLIEEPVEERGNLNASRYVAIGSTETSGFSDGALYRTGQRNSYPALIARQIEATGSITFKQPLVLSDSGVAFFNGRMVPRLNLAYHRFCSGDSMLIPERKNVVPDSSGFFVNSQRPFNNLGLPGLKARDFRDPTLVSNNIYFARIKYDSLSTLLDEVEAVDPSFFTVWLGTQEVLDYAMAGGEGNAPNLATFRVGLNTLLNTLMQDSNTNGMIATVPDITEYPFFNTITYDFLTLTPELAGLLNSIYQPRFTFADGPNPFILADPTAPDGRRMATPKDKILMSIPVDSLKCQFVGSLYPMPGRYYLNEQEVAQTQQYVRDINAIITQEAAARNITVIDLNGLYASLKSGIIYNGVDFTNVLVTGNFFSLDGLNPSMQGNALIANQFLEKINKEYRATIPLLDPTSFTGPLFP